MDKLHLHLNHFLLSKKKRIRGQPLKSVVDVKSLSHLRHRVRLCCKSARSPSPHPLDHTRLEVLHRRISMQSARVLPVKRFRTCSLIHDGVKDRWKRRMGGGTGGACVCVLVCVQDGTSTRVTRPQTGKINLYRSVSLERKPGVLSPPSLMEKEQICCIILINAPVITINVTSP